ncbi:hypothetical protein J4E08_10425 [Sagittula sp. NFXS13]|uniref:hypothetical protein n=1 Tax=Sagittula sp. NFXS13 TaxID=2819095 RepID=UPI0032DEE322
MSDAVGHIPFDGAPNTRYCLSTERAFNLRIISLILLVSAAAPAAAQSVKFEGTVEAGVTNLAELPLFGAMDATASVPFPTSHPLSFEVGTYLYALDGKNPHETYAAFVWDGRIRLGVVRPAFDSVIPSVFGHTAPYLSYDRLEYTRSHNTVEAMRRTAVPWGVSVDGEMDALTWSVSAHGAHKGGFRTASAALSQQSGHYEFAAALESIWSDDGQHEGVNAKLGTRADFGSVDLSAAWLSMAANDRPNAIALKAEVDLTGDYLITVMGEFSEDQEDDAYGLAVKRSYHQYGDAVLAATDGEAGPGLHLTYAYTY